MWTYRDWVIDAINRDLPYDQFIIEQIAGDLLPRPTQDQMVATGFLRNSMLNEEGGIDPEQFRMEAMFDRMDAIGKGILGLTIQCAQCHNHKYDPHHARRILPTSLPFSIMAMKRTWRSIRRPEQKQRAELFQKIKAIEDDLRHKQPDWKKQMQAWMADQRKYGVPWKIVRPTLDESGGQKHTVLDDGSILAQGYAPTKHTTEFPVKVDSGKVTAVRLELLNDPNLPLNGPGRSIKGLFALTEFRVLAGPADKSAPLKEIGIAKATADVNPPDKELESTFDDRSNRKRITGPISYAIDRKEETAWRIDLGAGRSNVPRQAVFVFDKPLDFAKGTLLTFKLTQNHGGWNSDDNQNNNLGRFRFAVTDAENAEADPVPRRVRSLLVKESLSPIEEEAVFSYWRTMVTQWKEANDQIERLWEDHPEGSSQLVVQEREKLRETRLLKRGDFLKPGDKVQPGVPAILHPLDSKAPFNRLTFARWLVEFALPHNGAGRG